MAEFAHATNIPDRQRRRRPGRTSQPGPAGPRTTILTEFSRLGKLLDGAHIVMVGDLKYGRTVHSLIKLLALYRGVKFTLISPQGLEMPAYIIEQAAKHDNVIEQKRPWPKACRALTSSMRHACRRNALPTRRRKAMRRISRSTAPSSTPIAARTPSSCIRCRATAAGRQRPERGPEPRSAPGDLPPDGQRHSHPHGDFRRAAGRGSGWYSTPCAT